MDFSSGRISSDESGQHEGDSSSDRRRASRHSMMLQAVITRFGSADGVTGRVRNISDTGVRVAVTADLAKDTQVTVTLRGTLTVEGRVAVQGADFIAVQFDSPIDVAALLQPRATPRPAIELLRPVQPDVRRPGLKLR